MNRQHHIEALRKLLKTVRLRLAMLEAVAPPALRDRETRKRIKEVETEEAVAVAKLTELGVKP